MHFQREQHERFNQPRNNDLQPARSDSSQRGTPGSLRAVYDHIRNKDYGLFPDIPADKRTLNQFGNDRRHVELNLRNLKTTLGR